MSLPSIDGYHPNPSYGATHTPLDHPSRACSVCPVDATCGGALLARVMTSSTSPDTSQHDRPVLATSSPPLILSYLPLLRHDSPDP